LYRWLSLLDQFRFCETHFTTYQQFVANHSAISPFLGGIWNASPCHVIWDDLECISFISHVMWDERDSNALDTSLDVHESRLSWISLVSNEWVCRIRTRLIRLTCHVSWMSHVSMESVTSAMDKSRCYWMRRVSDEWVTSRMCQSHL